MKLTEPTHIIDGIKNNDVNCVVLIVIIKFIIISLYNTRDLNNVILSFKIIHTVNCVKMCSLFLANLRHS